MKLVPAEDKDKEYFANLSELVYRDLVERQVGPWDSEAERRKFEEKWKEHSFQKILLNGELVGGFWLQVFESYYQLREIQIHPDHQNCGIGTNVIEALIEQSTSSGMLLRLRVLRLNPATNLYKRLGFEIVGETDAQFLMEYHS
jgi:ribosomal protein S18 acetylase RimI-like enzyme